MIFLLGFWRGGGPLNIVPSIFKPQHVLTYPLTFASGVDNKAFKIYFLCNEIHWVRAVCL